jgi:pseudouridine-5'-phosphate glycosidase
MSNAISQLLQFKPEVQAALSSGAPVVALESTVITHGLAYPRNLETALAMENAVRTAGATPATIAILRGNIHVGLSESQLTYLAERPSTEVYKCSRRDLAVTVARGRNGGTTVAGTMIVAHAASIPIFATGGIGGVHRGHPFDVSADLEELGRLPVTVVCSGAKSILDLPATLEVLETKGVPVIGYQTSELPAFFARDSGLPVSTTAKGPGEVAAVMRTNKMLGLQSGILVVVPVPDEDAYDAQRAEAVIDEATQEAEALGIKGSKTTPWLLKRISELSGGESLRANIALLRNNGRVAAQISAALNSQVA